MMNLLSPWSALVAAAVAVPALLALYMLKLRRQRATVASTLLWQQSFTDLQANAPFQRLRWSALLALQLLLLLAVLLAFAEPVTHMQTEPAGRIVLIIDRSASMNAQDTGDSETRLDKARQAALEIVQRAQRASMQTHMKVITFAGSAEILTAFETEPAVLRRAIESIEPTDEPGNLQAALDLAGSFAAQGEQGDNPAMEAVLISDGVCARGNESQGFSLRGGRFRFVSVGPDRSNEQFSPVENVGIVALSARRRFDEPGQVRVFARLINTGVSPVSTVIKIFANDEPQVIKQIEIPPLQERGPGESTMTHELDLPGGALIRIEHNVNDALSVDDVAAIVVPAPNPPRVALVHGGQQADPFLVDLVDALEPRAQRVVSFEAYQQFKPQAIDAGEHFDFIIFDRVSPKRLPAIPTLTFGGAPAPLTATSPKRSGGKRILSWRRQHPIMRYVSLDSLVYSDYGGFDLPADGEALAIGPDGPVIAVFRSDHVRHVAVGFDLVHSNWPLDVSIVVFARNVLDFIVPVGSAAEGRVLKPGESVSVRTRPDTTRLRITGPIDTAISVTPGEQATLPRLPLAGVYRIDGAAEPDDRLAVSVLSNQESNIQPVDAVTVNARSTRAGTAGGTVPQELWRWCLAFAAVVLAVEWLMYCRRARV